jgi:hypothetical protein
MHKEMNERYRFIEQVVGWEGEINSTHISDKFSLTRQASSTTLKQYREYAPRYLQYNASNKAYMPTQKFIDYFSESEYLCQFSNYLNIVLESENEINMLDICYEVSAPLRNITPVQVRPILKAIRNKLAIDIGYISLSSPNYLDRIIQPHALIFDGLRWHVRAYCNKNQAFRDFTLSRFNGEAINEGKATYLSKDDHVWNTNVDVVIEADPRFNKEQKEIIEQDFQMKEGKKVITTRAAFVNYLLRRLRIDSYKNTPEQQQIVLTQECRKNISQYLPHDF